MMTTSTTTALKAIGRETALDIYRTAVKISQFDERFRSMLMSGQIRSIYYSPDGQEVISASVAADLRPDDYLCTTYRGVHDQIAKGVPLPELWAEALGRITGSCKGKGGPMHVTHRDSNLLLTTGIVGSGLPIGVGLGLAAQLREANQVVVVNFGDGASNIGAFHEALNLASVWSLPVIFVCQNNRYAEHTAYELGTSVARISDRAAGYSMPGVTVDGNEAVSIYPAARDAIARARAGEGPTLIEALTFRLRGHNMNDASKYMRPGELDEARKNDPVARMRSHLISEGLTDEQELDGIEGELLVALEEAVKFALDSAAPGAQELFEDVYAEVAAR